MKSLQFAVCSLQRRPTDGWWLASAPAGCRPGADGCQLPTPSHEQRSTPFGLGGALALAAALFLAGAPALAQVRSSASYAVTVDGIDSGGGTSTSTNYAQRASIGQAFATPPMAGTSYNNQPGLQAAIPADTQAPVVPAGLAATVISSSQICFSWSPSNDNVGVTQYRIYRNGTLLTTLTGTPPPTSFCDTELAPATLYNYRVDACDAVGNCSAQSSVFSATTQASDSSYIANLEAGFNLIGNSLNITLDVAAIFGNPNNLVTGVTSNILSIWKWNAVDGRWAFYSPQLTLAGNAAHAAAHHYELLAVINPGEGYWVNAVGAITLPVQTGTGFNWNAFSFSALPSGFNLITTADGYTPSEFNTQVSQVPPTARFVSLWAWDAVRTNWYFYSPLLGGLPAVQSYANSRGFLHFEDFGKTLGIGTGFWVNKP